MQFWRRVIRNSTYVLFYSVVRGPIQLIDLEHPRQIRHAGFGGLVQGRVGGQLIGPPPRVNKFATYGAQWLAFPLKFFRAQFRMCKVVFSKPGLLHFRENSS
jgi:hypothetical protein